MLPDAKDEARKLKVQASRFVLMKDVLYKRCFSYPYLRCLVPEEAKYVMREVHEGICGNHSGARSLVHKQDRDIISPPCKRTRKLMSKPAISVRGSATSLDNHRRDSPL